MIDLRHFMIVDIIVIITSNRNAASILLLDPHGLVLGDQAQFSRFERVSLSHGVLGPI